MDFLNRETVADLHARLNESLSRFGLENGMKVVLSAFRFTPYNVTCKVELALKTASGEALTREAEAFFHHAACYGLSPQDIRLQRRQLPSCRTEHSQQEIPHCDRGHAG